MSDWKDVGQVLLGSWPSQVAGWGREAIAAYVAELQARGLSPEQAVVALRCCESTFPPSAGEVASKARSDPSRPTFDEAYRLIYGKGGVLRAQLCGDTPRQVHPLVVSFVERQGVERLSSLPVDHEEWGAKHRRDLEAAWDRHVLAFEGREVAAIASGRTDLRQLDPLSSLGLDRAGLPSGEAA